MPDPQLPTMIGARVAAYSAGLLLAGGLLAADVPAVDPAVLVSSVRGRPGVGPADLDGAGRSPRGGLACVEIEDPKLGAAGSFRRK